MTKLVGIGDSVVDKYLHSRMMYPGGQALNVAVNARQLGCESAFLGVLGTDLHADLIRRAMSACGIDGSRCRTFEGENGYAYVNLVDGERVFVGSNRGGVLREHPITLDEADLAYLSGFDLIHADLNSRLETELEKIRALRIPFSFDFSTRGTADYFARVCPNVDFGFIAAGSMTEEECLNKARLMLELGCGAVVATMGADGSLYLDAQGSTRFVAERLDALDTMGAGDSFIAGFMVFLQRAGCLSRPPDERIREAMAAGSARAAHTVMTHGAFGMGEPYEERGEFDRLLPPAPPVHDCLKTE